MDYPSIWQSCTLPDAPPLAGDTKADVAILGSGLCGLLTAYRLWEQGVTSLAVLDAGPLCGGATAHTTAKITSQHAVCYDRLLRGMGQELAQQYATANQQAVEQYAALVQALDIDCAFTRCDALVYARDAGDAETLGKELDAATALGLPATLAQENELPFPVERCLRFANQAHFHPLLFADALIRFLQSQGVRFYPHTTALHPENGQPSGTVRTDKGCVTAEAVVVATHFPFLDKPGFYFARVWQERSYVLALADVPPMKNLYWGMGKDGYSFRPFSGGILLGGGTHKTGHEGDRAHYEYLETVSRAWYPDRRVTAQWSAQDCMTHDGIPYIGRYRQLDGQLSERVYVATGFGKWGMTASMAAADILSTQILGKEHPCGEVFSPSRFDPGMKAKKFVTETADMAAKLIGGYLALPESTAEQLAPGDGGVFEVDGKRVGAYKDTDGTVYTVRPYCTHLGCALEFNRDESSWDCPCHGSRFDYKGHILNNPAVQALPRRHPADPV